MRETGELYSVQEIRSISLPAFFRTGYGLFLAGVVVFLLLLFPFNTAVFISSVLVAGTVKLIGPNVSHLRKDVFNNFAVKRTRKERLRNAENSRRPDYAVFCTPGPCRRQEG